MLLLNNSMSFTQFFAALLFLLFYAIFWHFETKVIKKIKLKIYLTIGCSARNFSCGVSNIFSAINRCYTLDQRCDGRLQCENGKDEKDCAILTAEPSGNKGVRFFFL